MCTVHSPYNFSSFAFLSWILRVIILVCFWKTKWTIENNQWCDTKLLFSIVKWNCGFALIQIENHNDNTTTQFSFESSRRKQSDSKSSLMWTSNVLSTIVGGSKSSASKTLSGVRYSSIAIHGRSASGQIILPLDVEETVTCFCRFAHTNFALYT